MQVSQTIAEGRCLFVLLKTLYLSGGTWIQLNERQTESGVETNRIYSFLYTIDDIVNGLDPRTCCPPKSLNTTNGKKSRAPMPFRYHVVATQVEDSSPCSPLPLFSYHVVAMQAEDSSPCSPLPHFSYHVVAMQAEDSSPCSPLPHF